jgi:predicted Fe-S protein YdhL (DUF1289 family)
MAASEPVSSLGVETPCMGVTVDYIRHWCAICERFNEWQHRHIIGQNPELEAILKALDAATQAREEDSARLKAHFEARMADVLEQEQALRG